MRRICTTCFSGLLCGLAAQAAQAAPLEGLMGRLANEQPYKAMRQSSFDPSGGNADGRQDWPIQPGETRDMAVIEGPGAITHIWVTIASSDPEHLRNLVLRMYWDGEEQPSVECPIGDFFGLGWAKYYQYSSMPIQIGTMNGLNCFWRMPFSDGARITVTNDGPIAVGAFYYYVNYQVFDAAPESPLRFHAQYRQEYPCTPGRNYTMLEARGRGHYAGVNLSIHNRANGWWGEGDDMIYVDGETFPSLHGTGSEDYFCGAWCYGEAFSNLYFGCPLRGEHKANEYWNVYRYHIEDPVPFTESIRVTIEHGHDNDRNDDFSSVAYWYQTEPHAPFPALPEAAARMPEAAESRTHVEPGAIEMEIFIGDIEGDGATVQDMSGFGNQWSNGEHVWFQAGGPAAYTLRMDIPETQPTEYEVTLWHTAAPDYGQVEAWFNGEKAAAWDGYDGGGVVRKSIPMTVTVKPGENVFELRITGKHPDSSGYMAGIDCFRPEPR